MRNRIDYESFIGQRFGRLTVLKYVRKRPDGIPRVKALCDCGKEKVFMIHNLYRTSLNTKSCGCLNKEYHKRMIKHGHLSNKTSSSTYNSWRAMMGRCYYPSAPNYFRYGGNGIKICERWHSFVNFLADMGIRPDGLQLSRQDESKGYEPGNVKWETPKENCRKREENKKAKKLALEHKPGTEPLALSPSGRSSQPDSAVPGCSNSQIEGDKL